MSREFNHTIIASNKTIFQIELFCFNQIKPEIQCLEKRKRIFKTETTQGHNGNSEILWLSRHLLQGKRLFTPGKQRVRH